MAVGYRGTGTGVRYSWWSIMIHMMVQHTYHHTSRRVSDSTAVHHDFRPIVSCTPLSISDAIIKLMILHPLCPSLGSL